jgi:hypothetical protein
MTSSQPIETETIQVTPTVKRYLEALQEYGLMEGEDEVHINATGETMLRALHHFLAGGEVAVTVVTEGSASAVQELDGILDRLQRECATIPQSSGVVCY